MIGVGIIGASPGGSWGSMAHIPAIQSIDGMRVAAVATSRMETAQATTQKFGVPLAFDDPFALASHPDVDLVTVAVRVPEHDRLVRAALKAGKHVYCEWPLARTTEEAIGLRDAAMAANVSHVIGLQSHVVPIINHVKDLVAEGYLGRLIATTMIHSGAWLTSSPSAMAYLQHLESGGHFLSIRAGHSLDALCYALGDFTELNATVATQIPVIKLLDTEGTTTRTTPDQVALTGLLPGGAVAAVHMQGGPALGAGLRWEISGTKRDLLITAPAGTTGIQMATQLSLFEISASGECQPIAIPSKHSWVPTVPGIAFNVAQMYARFRDGLKLPDFSDAVRRHQLLDTIMMAAKSGQRQILPI